MIKVLANRRKAVRAKYGKEPGDYTSAVLRDLAAGPILDANKPPLPAGKLSAEEARRRQEEANAGASPRTK